MIVPGRGRAGRERSDGVGARTPPRSRWHRAPARLALALMLARLALAPALPAIAAAQPAVTIMAPAAPGGGWDQTARVMQQVLRETRLAPQVQVLNAAGAAGTIGLARFVQSERGNPHALLVTGLVMVSGIATNRPPVTLADVTPLARLSGEYQVIVVPATSPLRTLAELIAAFRANPRAVSWGGGSAGGTDEVLVRLLAERTGVPTHQVNYIAYSGGGQALASVMGAHVSAAVSGWGEFASQVESGALRALAISSPARVPGVDVPTFREQGVDLELLNWRGVVAPPGLTPAERRAALERVRRMARSDAWASALSKNGWADLYLEGDAFERFLREETARIAPVIARAGGRRPGAGLSLYVLLGGALALAASLIETRRGARGGHPAAGCADRTDGDGPALATLTLALVAGAALFEPAGFWLAATGMFAVAARAFGSRRSGRDLLVGSALAGLAYLVFTRGLGVHLPPPPWP